MKKILTRIDFWLFITWSIFAYSYPAFDIWVSQLFFTDYFYLKENLLFDLVYEFFLYFGRILPILMLLSLGYLYLKKASTNPHWQKKLSFLFLVLLIGPGIIANTFLKDNSLGRPRPKEITEFNGTMNFVPAFTYSGECAENCSFPSGHAAFAFYFICLAWISKRRYLFTIGVVTGILVGATRVFQGYHFVSDIVFSFWIVYFTTIILGQIFNYRFKPYISNSILPRSVSPASALSAQ